MSVAEVPGVAVTGVALLPRPLAARRFGSRNRWRSSFALRRGGWRGCCATRRRAARRLCRNPARRFGLLTKGEIAVGYDADLVLLDPEESFVVRAAESSSAQGYTPFEGIELKGRVKSTFLRGELICQEGKVLGEPRGRYLKRPYGEEPKV